MSKRHASPSPTVVGLLFCAVTTVLALAASARAELYGIGRAQRRHVLPNQHLDRRRTRCSAFSNVGTTATFHLAYNPVTNRFVTVADERDDVQHAHRDRRAGADRLICRAWHPDLRV